MTKIPVILAAAWLAGCAHGGKPGAEPQASLPAAEDLSALAPQQAVLVQRTMADNLDDNGQVASRKGNDFGDQGDAGIFTGLLLASVDCPTGAPLLASLIKGIEDNGGMIPRHNPLVASANGPTTRDQASGVMLGLVSRWRRCPDDRPAITSAWMKHMAYVNANGGDLGPTSDGKMLTLRWLWGAVGQYFSAGSGGGSKPEFETGLVTTASSVNAGHQACYPVHVGTVNAITSAKIGKPLGSTSRGLFCNAARGLQLPLTEWYCGRASASSWLTSFKLDTWLYRHQRCPNWETPDAKGAETPGVDFLDLYELALEGQS